METPLASPTQETIVEEASSYNRQRCIMAAVVSGDSVGVGGSGVDPLTAKNATQGRQGRPANRRAGLGFIMTAEVKPLVPALLIGPAALHVLARAALPPVGALVERQCGSAEGGSHNNTVGGMLRERPLRGHEEEDSESGSSAS